MTPVWRKANTRKACEVCGTLTWALSCHLGALGRPRCMIHGHAPLPPRPRSRFDDVMEMRFAVPLYLHTISLTFGPALEKK